MQQNNTLSHSKGIDALTEKIEPLRKKWFLSAMMMPAMGVLAAIVGTLPRFGIVSEETAGAGLVVLVSTFVGLSIVSFGLHRRLMRLQQRRLDLQMKNLQNIAENFVKEKGWNGK